MNQLEKFRQWCQTHSKDSKAHQQFLQWFRNHEQEKISYIQQYDDFWTAFVEKRYLNELDFELFFSQLKRNSTLSLIPISSKAKAVASSPIKNTIFAEKYELLEKIGQGGMGTVYKVKHRKLNVIYALKMIRKTEETMNDIARFQQEAEICARLKHPGIVQVVDFGIQEDIHYLVMEFVEGKTFAELLKSGLPLRQGIVILKKILEALHYAHEQGVIHRDLKPENIFVTKNQEPKIGDFGIAKKTGKNLVSKKLTKMGELLGTPRYMSPEQIQGYSRLTPKTDVYSMGICLYEVLTGSCPFEDSSIHALLYKIIHEEPLIPSKKNPKVHRDLDTIALKAIEKSKHKRYASAKIFGEDLEHFLSGYPIQAKPITSWELLQKKIKQYRFVLLFSLVFLLSTFGAIYYFFSQKHSEKINRFRFAYQSAQYPLQLANAIQKKDSVSLRQKIGHLLKGLNALNLALSLQPYHKEGEAQKLEVGKELIQIACSLQEYQLAEYVKNELATLSIFTATVQKNILNQIESEKKKQQTFHQKLLEEWLLRLQNAQISFEEQEDAVFELIQAKDAKVVLKKLFQLLQEGTEKIRKNNDFTSEEKTLYFVVVEILGRTESKDVWKPLFEAMNSLQEYLSSVEQEKRNQMQQEYLIHLVHALSWAKAVPYLETLPPLRVRLGEEFWQKIQSAYEKLQKEAISK